MLCLIVYALLYPGSKIGIIAPSFRQSRAVIEDKYKSIFVEESPFLAQEEESYKCSIQSAIITFYNRSYIEAYPVGAFGEYNLVRPFLQ